MSPSSASVPQTNPEPLMGHHDPALAYRQVLKAMARAAKSAGRSPETIRLTAVSKQQPWSAIEPVLKEGHRYFGENRVQEAYERWADQKPDYPNLHLSLIGPLQSNKTKEAVALFDRIETLDREKIIEAIAHEVQAQGRRPECLIQINIGNEPQKAGVSAQEADALIEKARRLDLNPLGLMCIPPVEGPRGPYFALLRKIAERNGLFESSMGMSDDFETAIAFGSTEIRVGSLIFGSR